MENRDKWRLCAGTFFVLISHARNSLPTKDKRYKGKRSLWTEPGTLLALSRIVTPDIPKPMASEEKTLRDNTRDLKACINWGGGYFHLGDASSKKAFDDRIKDDYASCLNQMTAFTNTYLELRSDSRKDEFLVKALLDVLAADKEIKPETELYANEDGTVITKRKLLKTSPVCFEALLLGLWHYVLLGVDSNKVGADTYNEWCPPKGGGERLYEANIGENSKRKVDFTFHEYTAVESDAEASDEEEDFDDSDSIDADFADTDNDENVSPGDGEKQDVPVVQQMYNDHPSFFQISINGNNNNVIAHADNVYNKKD